jgi:hypothetical protein
MSALTAELALIDISRGQRMWLEAKALIDELSDRFENEDASAGTTQGHDATPTPTTRRHIGLARPTTLRRPAHCRSPCMR